MAAAMKKALLRGRLRENEPMSRHSSWRTGGPAARYFEPADVDDLVACLRDAPVDEAFTWVGLGSNLLVRDGGIAGTVISTARALNDFTWLDDGRLRVACGVACAKVAKEAAKRGHPDGAFLAGIPGTMGGALAMNAGAFGHDTWSIVDSVELIDRRGDRRVVAADAVHTAYRFVELPSQHWFLGATLRFRDDADAGEGIRDLLNRRNATQPTGQASCGSVFKNPPDDYAGRLIDAAGLKGLRAGGCHVSTKHANFIINDGNASAADIERLISIVQRTVAEKFGVVLEPEVRIVGEPAPDRGVRV